MIAPMPKPKPTLLITVDVEIAHDRDLAAQGQALLDLAQDLQDIPSTWFVTADAAEQFAPQLQHLASQGHEIGCHGLDHSASDDYGQLPEAAAQARLQAATARITRATGQRPRAFRGPRMTTSTSTQRVLRALGYRSDFSISSRRFDPFAASRFNWRWLGIKAAPYHPSPENAYLASPNEGASEGAKFWVVPLSGFGLPFLSGLLFLAGGALCKLFSRLLERIASRQNAPLVYLFHSYEFVDLSKTRDDRPWHHRFYMGPATRRYHANLNLIRYLKTTRALTPLTASQFLTTLLGADHAEGQSNPVPSKNLGPGCGPENPRTDYDRPAGSSAEFTHEPSL